MRGEIFINSVFFILLFSNIDQGLKFVVFGNFPNYRSIKHWASHHLTVCGQRIQPITASDQTTHHHALRFFFYNLILL